MAGISRKIGTLLISLASICAYFVVINADAQRNYLLEMVKVECRLNSSHIKAFECSLRNDSNTRLLDMHMELATSIHDFKIRSIAHVIRKGMPRMTILDLTLNGCELLDTLHKHKILNLVVDIVKRYLNVVPKCPFRKDFNYTVTGLQIKAQDFPPYLPECEFINNIYLMLENKLVLKISLNGRVTYLKK